MDALGDKLQLKNVAVRAKSALKTVCFAFFLTYQHQKLEVLLLSQTSKTKTISTAKFREKSEVM